ncbi:hypothetical protein ACHAO9_012459 [Fusarium lateritium]
MQFTIIFTALSFGIGAHAWAQAANGEWIANNELGWDYASGLACEGARRMYLDLQGAID